MADQRYPMSVAEVARLVGKHPDTIRAGVRAGEIQCHRRGRRGWIWFTREDLDAFLGSCSVPARTGGDADAA